MREEEKKRIDLIFKVYGLAMVSPMEILTSNRLYPQNIEYFKENEKFTIYHKSQIAYLNFI